jgi:photosystem II stability/assembly factor-like uncharacterized protein
MDERRQIIRRVFFLLFLIAPLLDAQWRELGPAPIGGTSCTGRVSAIALSSKDAGLYYLAGADGGVWRSRDGGRTWTPLTDHLPTTSIGALALDPSDERIVYAGSGEANFANHSRYGLGIYKSTDGGDSWEVLGAATFGGRCIAKILIDPQNTRLLYAAVTTAGGLPAYKFDIAGAKGHPLRNGPLGVFKSDDGGRTWTHLGGGLPGNLCVTDLVLNPRDPRVLYAAVGHVFGDANNGIYRTADAGASWTKLGGGLPSSRFGRVALGMAPSDPNKLYASFIQASNATGDAAITLSVCRTDDGGGSWTAYDPGSIHATYGYYLNVLAVSPLDANTVLTGGVSLWKSTNGGSAWTDVGQGIHVDHHALAWDAAGRLLDGNDGGIFRSDNLGVSWTPLNDGLGLIQFYAGLSLDPFQPNILYAGCQDNGTLKRLGPGKADWDAVLGGDGGYTAVQGTMPQDVLAEYQGTGNLFRSTDGGKRFTRSSAGIASGDNNCFLPPLEFVPRTAYLLFYATQRLYASLNGGRLWFPWSPDLTSEPGAAVRGMAIAPSHPESIYVATNDGRVLATHDYGKTWFLSLTNVPGWPRIQRPFAVHPGNHLEAYLAVSSFGADQALKTTDGGMSWESIDGDLPDIPANTVLIDEKKSPAWLFLGTDLGVYYSRDDGGHWEKFGTGLPNCGVIDIRFDPLNQTLLVATQGRGMWEIAYGRRRNSTKMTLPPLRSKYSRR